MANNDDTTSPIKNLYCVEFPGNVQNVDRMTEMLGGIDAISIAFADMQPKLECRFRPQDRFCKSVSADHKTCSSFLLKIVVKRSKSKCKNETDDKAEIVRTSVVGKVDQVFTFRDMCDFQFLPMERNSDGKLESVYDKIIPKSIVPSSWFSESVPLFVPPPIFSRMASVQSYLSSKIAEQSAGLIGRTRDRRSNFVRFVSYDCKEVPKRPDVNTLRYVKMKLVTEEQILGIKKLFEERPIWTKSALDYLTKYSDVHLKYLLALTAYHFISGPYRIAWVRFGYDPRKDVTSRNYQILDYRLRGAVQLAVQDQFPTLYCRGRTKTPKMTGEEKQMADIDESNYKFRPGWLPPQKQMFYQLCDIEIPEVQKMLETYPYSGNYDPKSGWLTEAFLDCVRVNIDNCILSTLQSLSKDEINSSQFFVRNNADQMNSGDSSDELESEVWIEEYEPMDEDENL